MKPQHFDILGSVAFLYITTFAIYAIFKNGDVPTWNYLLLAGVGLGGLVVDVAIVFKYFLSKK